MSKAINYHLRQEREQRGWSQARVAEFIGTDAVNVSRWERGHATPSPYFREKLCQLFEKNAADLGFLQDQQIENEPQSSSSPVLEQSAAEKMSADGSLNQSQILEQKIVAPDGFSRLLAVLGYLAAWVSALFIFLLNKNRFVRFHCLQAMLFFATSNLLSLIILICMGGLDQDHANKLLSLAELGLPTLLLLINLFTFIVWIVGMVQAWRGNYYQLPFVGPLSKNLIISRAAQTPSLFPESVSDS